MSKLRKPWPVRLTFLISRFIASVGPLDGEYRVVIMNTSAQAGVNTNANIGVAVPGMTNVGLLVLIIGLVIVVLGVVPLVLAMRAQRTAPGRPSSAVPPWGDGVPGPPRDPARLDQLRP